jgi:predicted nuclease of restriction endonuclease-like (RecB) superfamily
MVQFDEAFPEQEIAATLCRQLSWSHFRELLPLQQPLQRESTEMARIEGWSVPTLQERINSMLYERTALSSPTRSFGRNSQHCAARAPDTGFAGERSLSPGFSELNDRFLERALEDAVLHELETFLLELRAGFSFMARQKRIQLDGDDFYIDRPFYTRKLKQLVMVELKLGAFKPEYRSRWNSIFGGSRKLSASLMRSCH